jgi:serine protease Do
MAEKKFATLALFAPLLLFPLPGAAAMDFEFYAKIASTVVKIEAANPDGSTSVGSAVVVGPNRLVTNCHVTRNATTIAVIKSGQRWSAQKQLSDVQHDLCLLYVPGATVPVARFANAELKVGQLVYAIGYVNGLGPRMTSGQVRALYNYDGGKVIQSTTQFRFGASGGGLFDEQGRLVGVVTFISRLDQSYDFSLPVSWVTHRMAMDKLQNVAPLPEEFAFWQQPYEREPFFLQAAALEAGKKWNQMLELAQRWSAAESGNSNSWLALGKAHQQLQQYDQAVAAYRKAIALERDYPEAWYNLGLVYLDLGKDREAEDVSRVLGGMDQELAQELSKAQTLHQNSDSAM